MLHFLVDLEMIGLLKILIAFRAEISLMVVLVMIFYIQIMEHKLFTEEVVEVIFLFWMLMPLTLIVGIHSIFTIHIYRVLNQQI